MAYKTSELKRQALKAIDKHRLIFISDILGYVPCSRLAFYKHFPIESNDYKDIIDALYKNMRSYGIRY